MSARAIATPLLLAAGKLHRESVHTVREADLTQCFIGELPLAFDVQAEDARQI